MKYLIVRLPNGCLRGMWIFDLLKGLCLTLASAIFLVTSLSATDAQVLVGPKPQMVEDQFLLNVPDVKVTSWIENLNVPWSLVFLPDGSAMVSERPGRIRIINKGVLDPNPLPCFGKSGLLHETLAACFGVVIGGEGGLMGLALHPQFGREKPYLYVMHTYERRGRARTNRVIRLRLDTDGAHFDQVIIGEIPGGKYHNGGRIAFGPDGMLYVTTGETFDKNIAQDPSSLGGKLLRVKPDGQIPDDNPIAGSVMYSSGHRNMQGLAWDKATGDLFATEHGPSGEFGLSNFDEVNIITAGGNYGWPLMVGAPGKPGFIDPILAWPDTTTPPAGMTFWRGDLMIATLGFSAGKARALLRVKVEKKADQWRVEKIERWFADGDDLSKYGRLRDVITGPEGALYVLTSNRDGRGNIRPGDDKILKIEALP